MPEEDEAFRFLTHDEFGKLTKFEKLDYLNRAIDVLQGQGSWQAPSMPEANTDPARD